jgi:outer membrane protein TolC
MTKAAWLFCFLLAVSIMCLAQTSPPAPLTIPLQDALRRAQTNSVQFQTAVLAARIAREDRVQTRAAFLPSVNYSTQYLYTEGNGTPSGVFIANNAVHEYLSQGNAHEVLNLGPGQIAAYRRSGAALALSQAKEQIAARGLVVTVVQNYYGLVASERKQADAQQAEKEAEDFVKLSQELERGGEVAHSDVVKAQLQFNDKQVALQEAQLATSKARLTLAVLLFPNFNQDFAVTDDLGLVPALPAFGEIEQQASRNNPDLHAALAALNVAKDEVTEAWSAHLPTLTLDYWYGIDATRFATYTDKVHNLGYSAAGTLEIPIWNWGAIQSKVHQAQFRREQARLELSAAQRQLVANLHAFYEESAAANTELKTLSTSASLAADSLRLTTLRYRAGDATALEVVDAQNVLTLARSALADAQARYRVALANLQTLTGSLNMAP